MFISGDKRIYAPKILFRLMTIIASIRMCLPTCALTPDPTLSSGFVQSVFQTISSGSKLGWLETQCCLFLIAIRNGLSNRWSKKKLPIQEKLRLKSAEQSQKTCTTCTYLTVWTLIRRPESYSMRMFTCNRQGPVPTILLPLILVLDTRDLVFVETKTDQSFVAPLQQRFQRPIFTLGFPWRYCG